MSRGELGTGQHSTRPPSSVTSSRRPPAPNWIAVARPAVCAVPARQAGHRRAQQPRARVVVGQRQPQPPRRAAVLDLDLERAHARLEHVGDHRGARARRPRRRQLGRAADPPRLAAALGGQRRGPRRRIAVVAAGGARRQQPGHRVDVDADGQRPRRILEHAPREVGAGDARAAGQHHQQRQQRQPRRAELPRTRRDDRHRALGAVVAAPRQLVEQVLAGRGPPHELLGEVLGQRPLAGHQALVRAAPRQPGEAVGLAGLQAAPLGHRPHHQRQPADPRRQRQRQLGRQRRQLVGPRRQRRRQRDHAASSHAASRARSIARAAPHGMIASGAGTSATGHATCAPRRPSHAATARATTGAATVGASVVGSSSSGAAPSRPR
jgi:hypothetical protein